MDCDIQKDYYMHHTKTRSYIEFIDKLAYRSSIINTLDEYFSKDIKILIVNMLYPLPDYKKIFDTVMIELYSIHRYTCDNCLFPDQLTYGYCGVCQEMGGAFCNRIQCKMPLCQTCIEDNGYIYGNFKETIELMNFEAHMAWEIENGYYEEY